MTPSKNRPNINNRELQNDSIKQYFIMLKDYHGDKKERLRRKIMIDTIYQKHEIGI